MPITWTNILSVSSGDPKIAALASGVQTQLLAEARACLSKTRWGDPNLTGAGLYDLGCTYLTAHLAALSARDSDGQKAIITAGPLSEQYATGTLEDTYDTTPYGKRFKALRRKAVGGPAVT